MCSQGTAMLQSAQSTILTSLAQEMTPICTDKKIDLTSSKTLSPESSALAQSSSLPSSTQTDSRHRNKHCVGRGCLGTSPC